MPNKPAANVVLLSRPCRLPGAPTHARRLRLLALRFMADLNLQGAEVSLSLVSDRSIRRLNRRWRAIDAATDVLSFPAGPMPGATPRPLGDIVISLETARRMTVELGTPLSQELALYLAHGLLHLLGFDHHTTAEERRMRAKEDGLLGVAGMLARSAPR